MPFLLCTVSVSVIDAFIGIDIGICFGEKAKCPWTSSSVSLWPCTREVRYDFDRVASEYLSVVVAARFSVFQ